MNRMLKVCLAALLAPLAGCGVTGPEGVEDEGETNTASLGVTFSGLTLSPGTVTGTSAEEHCLFNVTDFNNAHVGANLYIGRQIRISGGTAVKRGSCTVRDDGSLGANEVRMNKDGLIRIGETDDTKSYTVSIDTAVVDANNLGTSNNFYEIATDPAGGTATILAIAPHGGNIEGKTADQAHTHFVGALAAGRAADWVAYGYNSAGAHDHWHITSGELDAPSFPALNGLMSRAFPYAVAFHGFGQTGHTDLGMHVVVGGNETRLFRREIADMLDGYKTGLEAIYRRCVPNAPPNSECPLPGDLAGAQLPVQGDLALRPGNIINRFNAEQRGLQLEQAWNLRGVNSSGQSDAVDYSSDIAKRVASVYACLTDTAPVLTASACASSASLPPGGSNTAQCGRYVADVEVPAGYGAGFTVRGSLDVSALNQTQCGTVQGYVSIYKREGSRFNRQVGGKLVGVWTNGHCESQMATLSAAETDSLLSGLITDSLTSSPPATGEDVYRVTVSGTHSGSTQLDGVASLTRNAAPAAHCCSTNAACSLAVDACSCTCVGLSSGESAPFCKDPLSCVVNPCRGQSAVCVAGFCSAGSAAL